MSDPSRQRLIRAVRLLPGAVRVGRGVLEDIPCKIEGTDVTVGTPSPKNEDTALMVVQAEIRKLKSELRGREAELLESRTSLQDVRAKLGSLRTELEVEKTAFYEKATGEAAKQRDDAAKIGREEGTARGYEDGLKKAEASVSEEYKNRFSEALALLANIGESLSESRAELAAAHAPQLIRLWEMMLRKMLRVSVDLDPAVTERAISYILGRVSDRERISVYLNPSDVEAVEAVKEKMKGSIRGVKLFELLSDENVDRGSCLVETSLGIYDARWRTQLEQVSAEVGELLLEVMSSDARAD